MWQIYHNGEVNSKRIEDRVPFLEEATNSKELRPDVARLPSPRLIKTHLTYEAIPKGTNEETTSKYIYIARNPKDVAVSGYKFQTSLAEDTGLNAPWEFYANLFVQGKSKPCFFVHGAGTLAIRPIREKAEQEEGVRGAWGRPWRIVLLKVAYYATTTARNFAKLCQNYAAIPKLCSQNDVDSVHIGAQ